MTDTTHDRDEPGPGLDPEVSSPPTGPPRHEALATSAAAKTPRRRTSRRRRVIVVLLVLLVVALVVWVVLDVVRAPNTSTAPGSTGTSVGSSTSATAPTALSPAAQVAVDYTTLSYAGKWQQACQLDKSPPDCFRVLGSNPAYGLVGPVVVKQEEAFPASGVAGQAYTGVLLQYQQSGNPKPSLGAYLINSNNRVAAFEPVNSENATQSLREILQRDMK